MTPSEILDLPMQPNDSGAATVRGYLVALLARVWDENEGFSGKRPFGNSGWDVDLHLPLIKAGLIEGSVDEDGYLEHCDDSAGDRLIADAIAALREPEDLTPLERALDLLRARLPADPADNGPVPVPAEALRTVIEASDG